MTALSSLTTEFRVWQQHGVYRAAGYIVDCLWALLLKLFEASRVCSIGTTSDTFSSNAHLLGMIPSSTLNQKPSVSGGGSIFLKLPYFLHFHIFYTFEITVSLRLVGWVR